MRTIKFRCKHYGKWYYGNIICRSNKTGDGSIVVIHNGIDNDNWIPLYEEEYCTIGQFTGLRDKNGKEIYEGDIVRFPTSVNEGKYRSIGYIGFHQLSASFRIITKSSDLGLGNRCGVHEITIEVIGNIHDNPELLQHN